MSTTAVWHWLPMWLLATNSTSALSGGVQSIAVRYRSAGYTFIGSKTTTPPEWDVAPKV